MAKTQSNTNLELESRTYRIIGLTPILGSLPASKAIRTQFIINKAPTDARRKEEEADGVDMDEKGLTVFPRDSQEQLCLMDYQVKGFLKSALLTLRHQLGIASAKAKADVYLFVEPRYIPIRRHGQPVLDEDEVLERPLRAQTMQGERVSLAASEMLQDPWEIELEITLLPNDGTAKSRPLTWEAVETALNYGAYHGLGQWRNAGYGRFRWERTDV